MSYAWKRQPCLPGDTSWLIREPERTYHETRARFLSSHALAEFRTRGPAYFRARRTGQIVDQDRPAYMIGRAAHALILEGEAAFLERYLVSDGPLNAKTGKPYGSTTQTYLSWKAEQAPREIISVDDGLLIAELARGVAANPVASQILTGGIAEGVVRADMHGEPCQGRLDYFHAEHGVIDLKTCDQLEYFESDARRYGYIYQMAFYRDLVRHASGRVPEVRIVAVEKRQPYRCGVWIMEPVVLDIASERNAELIAEIQRCRESGHWPTGYEDEKAYNLL